MHYRPRSTATFFALSDPTRRGILERLGGGPATISELAQPSGLTLNGIKKHVGILERADLVVTEKVGPRARVPARAGQTSARRREWIEGHRRAWEGRLDRFERFVERTRAVSRDLRFERLIAGAARARLRRRSRAPAGQREFYGNDAPGWVVDSRCDLRVGGVWSISFGPSPSELYRHRHVFEAIERPRRILLATTETRLDGSSFDRRTEFTFEPRDGGTLMTMVQCRASRPTSCATSTRRGLPNAFDRLERALRGPRKETACPSPSCTCRCRSTGSSPAPTTAPGTGLGAGGERLHDVARRRRRRAPRASTRRGRAAQVFDELMATGAVVVGRRTFDYAGRWNGDHHGVPIFVPTRGEPPEPAVATGSTT